MVDHGTQPSWAPSHSCVYHFFTPRIFLLFPSSFPDNASAPTQRVLSLGVKAEPRGSAARRSPSCRRRCSWNGNEATGSAIGRWKGCRASAALRNCRLSSVYSHIRLEQQCPLSLSYCDLFGMDVRFSLIGNRDLLLLLHYKQYWNATIFELLCLIWNAVSK